VQPFLSLCAPHPPNILQPFSSFLVHFSNRNVIKIRLKIRRGLEIHNWRAVVAFFLFSLNNSGLLRFFPLSLSEMASRIEDVLNLDCILARRMEETAAFTRVCVRQLPAGAAGVGGAGCNTVAREVVTRPSLAPILPPTILRRAICVTPFHVAQPVVTEVRMNGPAPRPAVAAPCAAPVAACATPPVAVRAAAPVAAVRAC
jgi:hypothetical protein